MKIVFVSNFLNHHQLPLCLEFEKKTEENFKFIATEPVPEERLSLGYHDLNEKYDFVICTYKSEDEKAKAKQACLDADVVILGSAPYEFVKERIKKGKVVFRFCERPLKNGLEPLKYLPRFIKWHKSFPMSKPNYMLCASAYTSADFAKFGLYINRCFKWGYLPVVERYDDIDSLIEKKKPMSLLWVARLIPLKHPEVAIEVARRLRAEGYPVELNIVGNGIMEDELKQKLKDESLEEFIHMCGSMSPEQVRQYMDKSEILLFTSDRNEGWGAVLNEAMNSACVPISSHVIGAAPFLTTDGVDGLIYEDGNTDDLFEKTKWLLDNETKRKEMAKNAYNTMANEWNAENAAVKFIELASRVLSGEKHPNPFENGVCSRAKILRGKVNDVKG